MERIRAATVAGSADPFAFLLGGGDLDHSYFHAGTFIGDDPYLALSRAAALRLITDAARDRGTDAGPPGLRLKMGDYLESCGAHGAVATCHSNCLLATAREDSRHAIREFYHQAATATKEDILNPACYPPDMLAHIPEAFRLRGYGCGSPVTEAGLAAGETVLDLGCGAGVECFIASRLVGPTGRVIGVDMLDAMLARAHDGARGVAATLGYDNLRFEKSLLEALPVADASCDVVISNCVLNLSTDKRRAFAEIRRVLRPGGRLVVSDVVSETALDPALANDPGLRGECLGGALVQKDLFGLLRESGFVAARVRTRFPYRTVADHPFFSMTFEAHAPAAAAMVRVLYRGPGRALITDDDIVLTAGAVHTVPFAVAATLGDEVLLLDDEGAATNVDLGSCSCCTPPEGGEGTCCAPPEASANTSSGSTPSSCCAPPEADVSLASASNESSCCSATAQAPSGPATGHRSGCLVCGDSLHYPPGQVARTCHYCGQLHSSNAVCGNGHFVCDQCHAAGALDLVERVCLASDETDLVTLFARLHNLPAVKVHGPEHHAIVPAVILSCYRNAGGPVGDAEIRSALARGATMPGGSCGFMGSCGAASGVATAFGIILASNPYTARQRRILLEVTSRVLAELAAFEAGRCCQRDCYLALVKAAELSRDYLPRPLVAAAALRCTQVAFNRECIGTQCPLFPTQSGAVRQSLERDGAAGGIVMM